MLPSSRTPDGNDGYCVICGQFVRIAPSVTAGDATCPTCGVLLWFDQPDESPTFTNSWREFLSTVTSSELTKIKDIVLRAHSSDPEDITFRGFLHEIEMEMDSR